MTDAEMPIAYQDVPQEQKWNAESLYASREAWNEAFDAFEKRIGEISAFRGRLSEGAGVLADAFELHDSLVMEVGRLSVYTTMAYNCNTTDQQAAAMSGRVRGLFGKLGGASAFLEPELLAIGHETLSAWLAEEPRLSAYGHYFDNLFRQQEHVRSAEVEEVLGMVSAPFSGPSSIYSALNNSDLSFNPAVTSAGDDIPISQSTIFKIMQSPDRALRRSAWDNYADGYLAFKNTFASNYSAAVMQDVFRARVRRYGSSLEAALFPNNIPTEVFHNLVNTFRKHLPTWHRYWEVRRRALGVDALHPSDIWAPISTGEPEVSFEQAVDWISEGMAPLGEDYVSLMRKGCLEDRWVDRAPNLGKQQGAFSTGRPGTMPFIKMSFTDNLKSMSTLAHELGHSMHKVYTTANQPMVYASYTLFLAEIASNFNQAMTRAWLLDNYDDPQFQVAVIEEAMTNFHRYFFIMPTLARFELAAHQMVEAGQALTAESLIDLTADLFAEGYGDAVEFDRVRVGITWAQFLHMYMNFYVYQYATGIAGAHVFASRVLAGEEGAVEQYLGFLSAGRSGYSLDILQTAGLDLSTPDAVEAAFDVMESYIDRLEVLTS